MATNLPDPARMAEDSHSVDSTKGFFARMGHFLRQVIDELRKVVTPTRSELVNYTLVLLVFVIIMMGVITFLDLLFGWGISWVFGDGSSFFG